MTVRELINKLEHIENKDIPIYVNVNKAVENAVRDYNELIVKDCNIIIDNLFKGRNNYVDLICEEKKPDCPLKPIQVKELEWEKEGDYIVAKDNKIKYELLEDSDYDENSHVENKSISLDVEITINGLIIADSFEFNEMFNVHTIEDAKEFCQKHYNKLILSGLEEK